MSELLRIRSLTKSFGRKSVLKDFSLTIEKGNVYGLLGRNGEGKTTLIRIIMGVLPADGGTMAYKNRPITFIDTEYKKEVGYIPEDPFFFDGMTVGRLIAFNRRFYPGWSEEIASRYLGDFGLARETKIRELSRGMKLKLELSVALAAEPEFLVLDDPTSGLDVPTRQDFLKDIIQELAASGTTILFSSHLVHELERVVDKLGILHGGRLVLEEDYDIVKERTKRIKLTFEIPPENPLGLSGTLIERRDGRSVEAVVYPWAETTDGEIASLNPQHREIDTMSLEDIFTSFVSGD